MGDGIRFVFDEEKAAQAAAYLIRLHGGPIQSMALLTLLYLADRRALAEIGEPITGDCMASMPHGPVLGGVHDLIHLAAPPSGGIVWRCWIDNRVEHETAVRGEPPADRLSRYNTRTLEAVHAEFGGMDRQALRGYMRALPEWEEPDGPPRPIPPERILEAEGKTPAEIERYRAEAERAWFFHHALSANPVPV